MLNRDFTSTRPNQKWVTDISYIHTAQGNLYLSVIRDLYDNSIVSYKMGTEQNVNLVLSTIRAAKRKEKVTAELQLHSDQGFQYTSDRYFKLTKSYGITQSMSRRGNPYDNALAENFFSLLKTECINRIILKTFQQARLLIDEYIYFYNNQRIQLKTKLTPLELRSQFVS
ncbi:MAG: IS3 family transposase [Oscillospiraceae bacterium]|nr:IS3 family transposase [Oscillospiraceae bacterium]